MYDLLLDTTTAERDREARRIAAAGHARRIVHGARPALITRVRRAIGGCGEETPARPQARQLSARG